MSAAAPNPNGNMILLAVLGIGAYWIMTRRANASTGAPGAYTTQQQAHQSAANKNNLIATGLNAMVNLFGRLGGGGSSSPTTAAGQALQGIAGTTIPSIANWFGASSMDYSGTGSLSDYVSGDGIVVNPAGFSSGYDYLSDLGL